MRRVWIAITDVLDRCVPPVARLEARVRLRGWRGAGLLMVAAACAVLLVCLLSSLGGPRVFVGRVMMDVYRQYAIFGNHLTYLLFTLNALLALLILPGITGAGVAGERARGTWLFLLLTRLSGWGIAVGKLAGAGGAMLLVLLGTLPVFATISLFGGVSPGQLLWGAALVVSTLVAVGSLGLYCSARFTSVPVAIAMAYVAALLWVGYVPGVIAAQTALQDTGRDTTGFIIGAISPLLALLAYGLSTCCVFMFRRRRRLVRWPAHLLLWMLALVMIILGTLTLQLFLIFIGKFNGHHSGNIGDFLYYNPEFLLVGNPLAGLVNTFDIWELIYGSWYSPGWVVHLFTPYAVIAQVLCAGLALWRTARRIARERRAA